MPPSCSNAVGLKASALQQVLPIVQRVRVDVYLVMEWVNVKSVVSFIILKVYHAVLFYMPSFTPLAWHRRTLRDEGHNTNVQPIVRSFAVRVSPLPPLSLFNMVMETADRRETNSSFPRTRDHLQIHTLAMKVLGFVLLALLLLSGADAAKKKKKKAATIDSKVRN